MLYLKDWKGHNGFILIDSKTCIAKKITCDELYELYKSGVKIPNLEGVDENADFQPARCDIDLSKCNGFTKRSGEHDKLLVSCVYMPSELDLQTNMQDLVIIGSDRRYHIWFKNIYAIIYAYRMESVYRNGDTICIGLPIGDVSFMDGYFQHMCGKYEKGVTRSEFMRRILL